MSKGQSLSMNTVIVAALALLVLIVLALIFMGKIRIFGTESRRCANQGGMCEPTCDPNEKEVSGTECSDYTPPQSCCVDLWDGGAADDSTR